MRIKAWFITRMIRLDCGFSSGPNAVHIDNAPGFHRCRLPKTVQAQQLYLQRQACASVDLAQAPPVTPCQPETTILFGLYPFGKLPINQLASRFAFIGPQDILVMPAPVRRLTPSVCPIFPPFTVFDVKPSHITLLHLQRPQLVEVILGNTSSAFSFIS